MAPRKKSELRKANSNSDSARNREYLNAHTGAGVNANRPTSIRGRGGSSRIRDTFTRSARGNQRGHQRRPTIPTPSRRILECLNTHGNRSPAEDADSSDVSNNDTMIEPQQDSPEQHIPPKVSTHRTRLSPAARNTVASMTTTANTPTTHPQLQPQHQHRHRFPSSSPPPNAFNCTRSGRPYASTPNITYTITPSPPPRTAAPTTSPRHPQHNRNTDDAKAANRLFSNPKLKSIMSGKAWPKERKKPLAERPILKMGIKKEYR